MWLYCGYMTGDGRTDLAPAPLPRYRPGTTGFACQRAGALSLRFSVNRRAPVLPCIVQNGSHKGGEMMAIPTEPIGSIPRPAPLIEAGYDLAAGRITAGDYARLAEAAVRETIEQLEATGSPVITDGEQGK